MTTMFAPGSINRRSSVAIAVNTELNKDDVDQIDESLFFESLSPDLMLEATEADAAKNMRKDASAAVIAWVEEGDTDADAFDAFAYGLAGGKDDEDLSDDEADDYNSLLGLMTDFCLQLGVTESTCQKLIDGDDAASETAFNTIEAVLENNDGDELISDFSLREQLMLEATKKVVRDGKVVLIKTNRRKRRMTAAQKAALKKARTKAHSSSAKAARRKAMRLRKSRGMK